jgi:hypothetical protein
MFDRYFADQRPHWRRRALMGASLALHGLLAAVVLGVTWGRVESAPIEVPLTFFAPPPPPPAGAAATPKAATARPKPRVARTPRLVRQAARPAPQEAPPEQPAAEPGGVAGGVAGGTPGGTVGGTGKAKVIPQFLADRERLASPNPHLPEWFTAQHPRQSVKGLYRVCVDNEGRVVTVEAVNGIAGVDNVITQQVLVGWRYKPQVHPFCYPRLFQFDIN